MSSREVRDLNKAMQVKYNKFHDLCRRNLHLIKHGIQVILICTMRTKDEQNKLAGLGLADRSCPCAHSGVGGSGSFDVALLRYGKVVPCEGEFWTTVVELATSVGLKKGCGGFYDGD